MAKVSKLKEILASRSMTVEEFGEELRLHREIRDLLAQDEVPNEKMRTKIAKALKLRPGEIWVTAPPEEIPRVMRDKLPDDDLFWHTMLINLAAIEAVRAARRFDDGAQRNAL